MGTTLMRSVCVATVAFGAIIIIDSTMAQWTVTNLHPAGSNNSGLHAVAGGQQAGTAIFGSVMRAGIWSGSAASWVDLSPAGSSRSEAISTTGTQQAGYAIFGGEQRAGIWNGSAASWVDLKPAGSGDSSNAFATAGTQQAGFATFSGVSRAGIWSGSAASWVELHPQGAARSIALGTTGTQQAGFAEIGNTNHAGVWSGSATSWVDLSPTGSTDSLAYAIAGSLQAGYATIGGVQRAGIWSGSAASWVDLNPRRSTRSEALDANGAFQAGYAVYKSVAHAGVWNGSAASWEDLSATLTGLWGSSEATSVWSDATTLYVAGYGFNNETNRPEALLWTRPIAGLVVNDTCVDRTLVGMGHTDFSTISATTDGPAHSACLSVGSDQVTNDIWYDHFSMCPGALTIDLCSATTYDTRIVVYDDVGCSGLDLRLITCNDDACGVGGLASRVVIPVRISRSYTIRIGGSDGAMGSGTLTITCCPADFNASGSASVQDIFDFIAAYFAGNPRSDFNGSGATGVQDLFDFLSAYFTVCS